MIRFALQLYKKSMRRWRNLQLTGKRISLRMISGFIARNLSPRSLPNKRLTVERIATPRL